MGTSKVHKPKPAPKEKRKAAGDESSAKKAKKAKSAAKAAAKKGKSGGTLPGKAEAVGGNAKVMTSVLCDGTKVENCIGWPVDLPLC